MLTRPQTANTEQTAALNHDLELLDHYNPQTDRLSVTRKRFNGRCLTVLKRTTGFLKKLWDALVEKIRHFFCSQNLESDYINNLMQHRGIQQELINRIHHVENVDPSNNAFIYIQNHLPRLTALQSHDSDALIRERLYQMPPRLPANFIQAPHTLFLSEENGAQSSSAINRTHSEEQGDVPHYSVRPEEEEEIDEEDAMPTTGGSVIPETTEDRIPLISLYGISDLAESDRMFIDFMNGAGELYGHTRASITGTRHDQLIASYGLLRHLILPNPRLYDVESQEEMIPMTPALIRVLSDPVNKPAVDRYIVDLVFETMLPAWGIKAIALANDPHLEHYQFYIDDTEKAEHLLTDVGHQANTMYQLFIFLKKINYFDLAKTLHRFIQSYRKSKEKEVNYLWVVAVFQGGPQEQNESSMREMANWLALRPGRSRTASQTQSMDGTNRPALRRRRRSRRVRPQSTDSQRPSTSYLRGTKRAWLDSMHANAAIEAAIQNEEQLASSMLDGFGLELIPTIRNGNCCFEAISRQSDNIPIQTLRQDLLQGALELAQMLDCHYGHNTLTTLSEEEQQYINSWLSDDVGGPGATYLRARREPTHDMCYTRDGAFAYTDDIYIFARRRNRPLVIGDMNGNLLGLADNNGHVLPFSNKNLNDDVVTELPHPIYLIFNGHNHFMGARRKIDEGGAGDETTPNP